MVRQTPDVRPARSGRDAARCGSPPRRSLSQRCPSFGLTQTGILRTVLLQLSTRKADSSSYSLSALKNAAVWNSLGLGGNKADFPVLPNHLRFIRRDSPLIVEMWEGHRFCEGPVGLNQRSRAIEERAQNAIDMSGRLYEKLNETDEELCNRLDRIREKAIEFWNREQYPRFLTDHGEPHINQVEKNLDVLTQPLQNQSSKNKNDDLKGALSSMEIFVLLGACYLHDIGMLLDLDDAREKHAEYTYKLIIGIIDEDRGIDLPITDTTAREAVADVARAHWTDHALELDEEEPIGRNTDGRIRLLGVLLAMSDLLDLSPVRARYFRTTDRLYKPDPEPMVHHTKHERVRRCKIAHNPEGRGNFRFEIDWAKCRNPDTEILNRPGVEVLNEWVLRRLDLDWRQLRPELERLSGGTIRWESPWAQFKFTERPNRPELPAESKKVLKAELEELKRIDRDEFVQRFKELIALNGSSRDPSGESVLFTYSGEAEMDGQAMADWCESQAAVQEECQVARVDFRPSDIASVADTVSQLTEQWDGADHTSQCSDREALNQLKEFTNDDENRCIVSIIDANEYDLNPLCGLIEALLQPGPNEEGLQRACLLLTSDNQELQDFQDASIESFGSLPIPQEDIKNHLRKRLGYSEEDSAECIDRMEGMGIVNLIQKPGFVRDYIEIHYHNPLLNPTNGAG